MNLTQVKGEAAPTGGVNVSVAQARAVSDYAERSRRQRQEMEDDEGYESEDAEIIDAILPVVDTDDEKSAGSFDSSSSGSSDDEDPGGDKLIIAKPLKPDSAATCADEGTSPAATGASKMRRSGYQPLWEDPYFAVWSHPTLTFVRVIMRDGWRSASPVGMGTANATRQVTPRHYQDSSSDPIRSVLLLRAWCLWRARQNGWADAQRGRSRHFKEQAALLERDIKALGSHVGFTGNRKADSMLESWVPDIVARLRA